MSARARGLLYLTVLHLAALALAFVSFREQLQWILLTEAVLLGSFLLGARLLNRVLQPMEYTQRLRDLLQEKNYVVRFKSADSDGPELSSAAPKNRPNPSELETIVEAFNSLLEELYQERLRVGEQRGFLQGMLEATPSAVLLFDFDGRISLLNASAQHLLCLHQPEGQLLNFWLDGAGGFEAPNAVRASLATGEGPSEGREVSVDASFDRGKREFLRELAAVSLDGVSLITDAEGRYFRAQRKQFIDRGFARQFLLIDEITTELKRSEKATYEKLVRVLAHEVNNTVAVTRSVLESLRFYAPQLLLADREDFLTAIDAASRRSHSLGEFIERFTGVVKMPDPVLKSTDLNALIDDIATLYRSTCVQQGIALDWQPSPAQVLQNLDRNLISQALINLVKNAIEAVQVGVDGLSKAKQSQLHSDADDVGSDLANRPPDEVAEGGSRQATNRRVRIELDAHAGRRCRLSVIDSANALALVPPGQLFSAFYSTKKGGQGIGLMFVREVLLRHGFEFRLESVGGETRFDIWLND